MLSIFGIGETAQRVYQAMLQAPSSDLGELATRLGLTVETLTAELDSLGSLMLVEIDGAPGPHSRYHPVPPDQAIENLIAHEEERLRRMHEQVASARGEVGQFVETFVEGRVHRDDLGLVEQIDDPQVVRSRLYQLVRNARSSVRSLLPGDALPSEVIASSARLDSEILRRGLALRFIVSEASVAAPHWMEHLRSQVAQGAQVRLHPAPAYQVIIVDDDAVLLPRSDCAGAVLLHSTDLVAPVIALFQEVWQNATVLPAAAHSTEGDEITEARLRQIVALLAQGHKDATIARRMGLSERTVRRLVSAVIEALHAESRFQAGVEALRQGWVTVSPARAADTASPVPGPDASD